MSEKGQRNRSLTSNTMHVHIPTCSSLCPVNNTSKWTRHCIGYQWLVSVLSVPLPLTDMCISGFHDSAMVTLVLTVLLNNYFKRFLSVRFAHTHVRVCSCPSKKLVCQAVVVGGTVWDGVLLLYQCGEQGQGADWHLKAESKPATSQ